MKDTPPLIILGLDAGDPRIIQQLVAAGDLPAMASIMDRGWHAQTTGPELFAEHGVWTSIFSGLTRSVTGYFYFRQLKPGTYDIVPTTGLDAHAPPFWMSLAGSDRKAAIVDVGDAYPIKNLAGAQLSNWAIHLGWATNNPAYDPRAQPPSLLDEARAVFGPREMILENSTATVEQDRLLLQRLLKHVENKGKLCRHILARDRYDLIFAVFHEVHTATHQFWKYRPEARGTADFRDDPSLRDAIRQVYIASDRQLGQMLAQLPAEANYFLIGTVGFKDYYPTTGLADPLLRMLDYQHSPPPGKFSWRPMDLARRILPESVRVALSKLLSRETRERIVAEQFKNNTDWSRTTAFALPTFYKTYIRVNLRGREPRGIVEPGRPYLDLLKKLESDFLALIDPLTGQSPIASIERAIDLFGAQPPQVLPDLFVEWKAPHFLSRIIHPRGQVIQARPEWYRPSDHTQHGFVAAAGPAFAARGTQPDVALLDLAPTFLKLLNLPASPAMRGRPLPVADQAC